MALRGGRGKQLRVADVCLHFVRQVLESIVLHRVCLLDGGLGGNGGILRGVVFIERGVQLIDPVWEDWESPLWRYSGRSRGSVPRPPLRLLAWEI